MVVENKIELVAIVTALIFLSGISRLYIFYKSFNITILPFVEPGEILIITFDSILYFIITSVYFFLVIFLFYRKNFVEKGKPRRLKSYKLLNIRKIIFLAIGVVLIVVYNNYVRPNPSTLELGFWCCLLVLMLYVVPISFFEISAFLQKKYITISNINLLIIFSAFFLLIFSISLSLNEVYKVKVSGFYEGSCIILKDGTRITSTSTFTFIGMTKNYLFFYDKVSGQTQIRPNEISQITTK